MASEYKGVQWNAHKKVYDLVVVAAILVFVGTFVGVGIARHPGPAMLDPVTLLIRAFGVAAVVMLHAILMIGPLARLDTRFLPLLYNRRHLGVVFFFVALVHGVLVTLWYGAFGSGSPIVNVVAGYLGLTPGAFPFEVLGLIALGIFFVMAATSHDFWLHNLTPGVWKSLHMSVYVAYALVVGHVALGAMQSEGGVVAPAFVGAGLVIVVGLHGVTAVREWRRDADSSTPDDGGWLDAGPVDDLIDGRAKVVTLPGGSGAAGDIERLAVYRSDGRVRAIAGVCPHQGGPLGEGRVVDGCVTCPWHGYQFKVEDGCSPPPFEDRVDVYPVRIVAGRVQVLREAERSVDCPPTPIGEGAGDA